MMYRLLQATVLEEMPPFPERESSILAKLKKKKPDAVKETPEERKHIPKANVTNPGGAPSNDQVSVSLPHAPEVSMSDLGQPRYPNNPNQYKLRILSTTILAFRAWILLTCYTWNVIERTVGK